MTPDDIRELVRAEMLRRGVSQRALAQLAAMHQPQLSKWLAGKKTITTESATRVMRALGITDQLPASPEAQAPVPHPTPEGHASPQATD